MCFKTGVLGLAIKVLARASFDQRQQYSIAYTSQPLTPVRNAKV